MQGRARGKGERKTHQITSYHHITMEFGGYLLNVAKNLTRARARKGEAQGVLSYQKVTGIFDNPHIYIYTYLSCLMNARLRGNGVLREAFGKMDKLEEILEVGGFECLPRNTWMCLI